MQGAMPPPEDRPAARVIEDTRRICAMPAPPFAEGPRAELVAFLLGEIGVAARIDDTGNVIAAPGGAEGPDAVVFAAHLDTVFAEGTEIAFAEGDGRLAAPGVGDNSIAVAALLHLARHLRGRTVTRPVVLAATVGEEGLGDLRGAKALLDDLDIGAFIAVEGQMLDAIKTAGVGSVRLRVTVRGPGGHPWSDRGTPSALHHLVDLLAGALGEAHAAGIVLNVGVVRGGTVINAIAGEASAELDLRSEDDGLLRGTAARVEEVLAWSPDGLEVAVEPLGRRPGGRVAPDHPLVAAARRARERAGLPPAEEGASSTDANAAYGRGIPAITVGVTTGGNAHRLDEYIDLGPVAKGLAALEALADDLAAG
jgi:acetylornithine deacetylase/succinyl-diaminopimelate desuccinylase-like protein